MGLSITVLSAVLVALVGVRLFINWSKLCKAPGPAIAGLTDLWRAYQQSTGRLQGTLLNLHARHGPIVRYGVKSISINDPEVINVVYGSRAGFITAESYKVLLGRQNGKDIASLISTQDENQHGAMRRSIANAFTPTATLDYERWIDATIEELLEVVGRKTKTKTTTTTTGKFELSSMIVWYTMDAAGRFSFGAPLGCLAAEADVGGSVQVIRDRFIHWARWASMPRLERLVHRNPLLEPKSRSPSTIVAMASEKLKARMNSGSNKASVSSTKDDSDAHSYDPSPDLLQRFLEARKDFPRTLDEPGIIGLLMSTISGASDTTASTVTAALFYLLKSPEAMRKLESELMRADLPEIPAYNDVSKLSYLNAVIKESMRLFSPAPMPLERLVPAGGITIAGMYFPEGASVGCMQAAIHRNTRVFGDDVEVFRPERWLIEDREQLRVMEAAHMGFSRGRRNCLGQNIALLQMKKLIPALLMKFKFHLIDPSVSFEADYATAAAVLKPLYVRSEVRM